MDSENYDESSETFVISHHKNGARNPHIRGMFSSRGPQLMNIFMIKKTADSWIIISSINCPLQKHRYNQHLKTFKKAFRKEAIFDIFTSLSY